MRFDYQQIAYVTNDLDRALAETRAAHGMGPFKELRDLHIPLLGGGEIHAHFAIAFKEDTQYELIQPLSGQVDFYSEVLPEAGFALRFHHIGRYFSDPRDYQAAIEAARYPVACQLLVAGGHVSYFDARAVFGHYLEYYTFDPGPHLEGVPRY